ncbi:MAG: hypothetical protein J6V11_01320, partial [Alphaproteobacteria bacterium]|nr:hypothetical protein [Alphaproteobacteria bacterium]
MKKFLILLTLLCTNIGSAQTVDGLFDLNNPALMQDSVSAKYTGQPVILIEKPSEEKKEAPNPAMLIPPPEFSRYHPKLKIKTPFGHDWTADFIEQITDRVFVVQIFDNKTIQVEEQIQFVTTDKNKQIEHVIPKIITDEQGKEFSVDVQVLSFSSDTDKIHPTITDSETEIKIAFDVNNVGLHTIMAKYLFKNVIQKNNSLAKVFFSLTGEGYPKMTERFSVWVLFPDKKVSFYKAELLFGKNNQSVKDNFIFLTDENNNLLLKTT